MRRLVAFLKAPAWPPLVAAVGFTMFFGLFGLVFGGSSEDLVWFLKCGFWVGMAVGAVLALAEFVAPYWLPPKP